MDYVACMSLKRIQFVAAPLALACAGLFAACAEPRTPIAVPNSALPAVISAAPAPAPAPVLTGPDEGALDPTISPCADFYGFSCGGWMKSTPIPEDEASWVRSFSVIHEDNEKALRAILERDSNGDTRGDAYGAELGRLWSSCMNEATIERRAVDDLNPELKAIGKVHDETSLTKEIAHLHRLGVGVPFGFDSEVDFKNSSRMIAGVSQSGLGLPERDYYFRDDSRTKEIRAQYLAHVARTLELLGEAPKEADLHSKTIMKIETDLAHASMTNIELRDPQKVYHFVDLDGLKKLAPDISWDQYLEGVGLPGVNTINVAQPEFVKALDTMTKSVKMSDWRLYLLWHLGRAASPWLSKKFVDEWFHFRQVLTGTKVLLPRWKRCVRFADQLMGEALARPFVMDHLGDTGKRGAERMVASIETAMKGDIESLSWMDDATRTKADEKLAKVINKIGFPAKWRSYDGLGIDQNSFVQNVERATEFEVRRRLAKVGKPVDKDEWEMTPPAVNAYYDPTMNQMVFPAGILQAPFYSTQQSMALNFGAIGMVVGHELTHGFDDEGRQFDADGNLRDWWSPPVGLEFDKRAACVERQYSEYVPIDEMHIKGKLTLGENIADLGGVKLSFAALERSDAAAPSSAGRFNREQQFFVGFAQAWCANYRPEALRLLVATNPHSPPKFRVNGPLSNVAAFARAFQCKEGSPMVRSAKDRCEVW